MEDKTLQQSEALALICPTCGARYTLPKYVEGQKYGCKRCSASLMFGKFALQQELGRGGFGVVYKAFQADLQRVVALKFLHTDSAESAERFMREARIAANLSHPNITAIYEVGQHDGKPYITMQFVDGITTNKADFSIREAVFVMRDAAIAVDYAHARDIIHRDIKPHNIMVTQERSGTTQTETTRRTFVMDFGLARSANKGGTLTTEGQVMGTPAFMSPEQAEGKSCDLRSDVYSLGATLFSLVTKRPPFEAPTPLQILMAVTQEDPPLPSQINPEVDKGLEAIIMKAMSKDPAHRYPTASRLAQDLTSWLAGGVTDAGPTVHLSMTPGSLKAAGKRKKQGTMVAVGAVLILIGAGGLGWRIFGKSDVSAPVVVDPRKDPVPVIPPTPKSTTVLLEVRTDPPEAIVRIENKEWKTPVALNEDKIAPGTYEIAISKPGYKMIKERVTVTAGPSSVVIEKKLEREARAVAFTLVSEPPGAKVLVNGSDTGSKTPCTIYQDEVGGIIAQIELELDGYVPQKRSFEPTGDTKRIPLPLKTGTFVVNGAVQGSTVHFFAMPSSVKNVRAVTGLWSDNVDSLEQAVTTLDPADVPLVVERLRALTARPEPRIRERAAKLAAAPPAASPLRPDRSIPADGRGGARLENAWVLSRYRIFITSPRTLDYLSSELEPRVREEMTVTAEMVVLSSVSVKSVRPAVGKFRVVHGDQKEAGVLAAGGGPIRVMAGTVLLHYSPPAGDSVLREFTVPIKVTDPYELAGSLYRYSAEAYVQERNIPMALRAYTKLLEEKQYPTSEEQERSKLPELVRALYRGWVDAAEKQGKTLGGDLPAKLAELKQKDGADTVPALMELYAAKDAAPAVRAGAAAAIAQALAKSGQPYESMEWSERFAKEKFDPGYDVAGALTASAKGFPGLPERWEAVSASIEDVRKAAQAKTDPPVPAGGAGAKVGVLAITRFGMFVKLDPEVTLSKGDLLEVFRDGQRMGEIVVDKTLARDSNYPYGAVQCVKSEGAVQKGDEIRRKK